MISAHRSKGEHGPGGLHDLTLRMLDIAPLNARSESLAPGAVGSLLGEQELHGRRDGRIGRPFAVGRARRQQPLDGEPGSVGEADAQPP